MHKEGHVGIGFLLYSPFAYYFVASDWMMIFALGAVAVGVWSFLPDIDMTLPISHRGPTHTLIFAAGAGLVTAIIFAYAASVGTVEMGSIRGVFPFAAILLSIVFGFAFGFFGVVGHIIGDALTPMGVTPWWPRSNRRHTLNLVYAADEEANKQLSMVGATALTLAIVAAELNLL